MASERSSIVFRIRARELRRRAFLEFARRLEVDVAGGRPFCCLVTGDDEIRNLNRQFRKKDDATDVLSFPSDGADRLGEIAISFDRARAQAADFGHSAEDEVRVLMLHGVLHLVGMDHELDKGEMRRVEQRWRRRLGLPSGLIERVDTHENTRSVTPVRRCGAGSQPAAASQAAWPEFSSGSVAETAIANTRRKPRPLTIPVTR